MEVAITETGFRIGSTLVSWETVTELRAKVGAGGRPLLFNRATARWEAIPTRARAVPLARELDRWVEPALASNRKRSCDGARFSRKRRAKGLDEWYLEI